MNKVKGQKRKKVPRTQAEGKNKLFGGVKGPRGGEDKTPRHQIKRRARKQTSRSQTKNQKLTRATTGQRFVFGKAVSHPPQQSGMRSETPKGEGKDKKGLGQMKQTLMRKSQRGHTSLQQEKRGQRQKKGRRAPNTRWVLDPKRGKTRHPFYRSEGKP